MKGQTQKQEYLSMGFKLMPSNRINYYLWYCAKFQKGSTEDSTWVWEKKKGNYIHWPGHHSCCGSRRAYKHKVGCVNVKPIEDLSDLKNL